MKHNSFILTLFVVLLTSVLSSCVSPPDPPVSPAPPPPAPQISQQQLAAVQGLNNLVVSVVTVADRNDRFVLRKEIDTVVNNLNLDVIDDIELVKSYEAFLRFSTGAALIDSQMALADRRAEVAIKNAIYSALPAPTAIIGGGINPAGLLMTAVQQGTSGYMQYRAARAEASWQREQTNWELEDQSFQQLMEFRTEFFRLSWEVLKKNSVPDEYRLTEQDVVNYVNCLKDENLPRRKRQLYHLMQSSTAFRHYAPFWFQLGETYQELGDHEAALRCYAMFERVYIPVFRRDPFYRRLVFNRAVIHKEQEWPIARRDIALLQRHADREPTYLIGLWSLYTYVGDNEGAQLVLRNAIDVLQRNAELAENMIRTDDAGGPVSRRISTAPKADPGLLGIALMLTREGDDTAQSLNVLRDLIENERFNAYEALWLSGVLNAEREMNRMLPDIAKLQVEILRSRMRRRDRADVTVPRRLFIDSSNLSLGIIDDVWESMAADQLPTERVGFSDKDDNFFAQFRLRENTLREASMIELRFALSANRQLSVLMRRQPETEGDVFHPAFLRVDREYLFEIEFADGRMTGVKRVMREQQ